MRWELHNGIWKDRAGNVVQTAPVQIVKNKNIPIEIAEEAYLEYAAQFGNDQSLERLNHRGGFSALEIVLLLFDRIKRLTT